MLWLAVCVCISPFASAARPDPKADANYQRYVAIAGAPQDSVRFFRVHHWRPINERALVLWLGREEPYLIDLRDRCIGLADDPALRIAGYQRPGRNMLRTRWSDILTRDGLPCRIGTIRALDFSRMKEIAPREPGAQDPRKPDVATPVTAANDARQWATLVAVHTEPPEYPQNATLSNLRGTTQVAAEVAADGSVRKTEVLVSSGQPDLDGAALQAVLRWRFQSPGNDDPTRPVWVQVAVVFGPDP